MPLFANLRYVHGVLWGVVVKLLPIANRVLNRRFTGYMMKGLILMKLTAEEKETIISFNEAEKTADVEAFNSRTIREIRKAAEMYPDEISITENSDGSIRAVFPRKWVKIRAPRILTDEQRAVMSERGKKAAELYGYKKKI